MLSVDYFFKNKITKNESNICIINEKDDYAINFGKQWKEYTNVQIDSKNNFTISKKFLESLLFDNLDILNNKTVLEIGCGAGRFTEYIVKHSKICISFDSN